MLQALLDSFASAPLDALESARSFLEIFSWEERPKNVIDIFSWEEPKRK